MEPNDLAVLEARWRLYNWSYDDLDWRLYNWSFDDLRDAADDLLSQGVDESKALLILVLIPRDELPRRGPEPFQQMPVESGGGEMTRDRAAAVMAEWIARGVLDGSIHPAPATRLAAELASETHYEYQEFGMLCQLDEPMTYLYASGGTLHGQTYDEVAAEVFAEARRLLAE